MATTENDRRQPETGPLDAHQPSPLQLSPNPIPLSQLACTKRKRSQDSEAEANDPEDVRSPKQPQRTHPSEPELSEQPLQEDSVAGADKPDAVRHSQEPQELPSQPPPARPSPSSRAPISEPASTKRKRLQDSKVEAEAEAYELQDARPSQQPRELFPSRFPGEILPKDSEAGADDEELPLSKDQLSEENLRLFNGDMDGVPNRPGSIKRTSSRRSIVEPSEAESFRSQRSSNTTAHYRYKHLKNADIYIHVDPPGNIRAAIDDIVNAELSDDRHAILRDKAKIFWKRCKEIVRAAAGEGDFVHLFHTIAEEMSPSNLIFREEADWRVELKPKIQQLDANWNFLSNFNAIGSDEQQEVGDDSAQPPPPKRHLQSAGRLYISPRNSQTSSLDTPPDNRPLQTDKAREPSPIKTPRPDITTGIKESALISALASFLSSQNFNHTKAKQFLEELQDITMPSERDGPQEPALIMVPTQRESTLTFPTLVFEGKGYSTGKQVFEAQNQAAVSGAGGLKIQMMLDELVKRATRGFDVSLTPSEDQPPLVFSICTEGPHHELWAHYTVIKDGKRQFNMVLLDTCHGVILKQVERFLVQIYNVMIWTTGPFLKTVVERLGRVARKATRPWSNHMYQ